MRRNAGLRVRGCSCGCGHGRGGVHAPRPPYSHWAMREVAEACRPDKQTRDAAETGLHGSG